DIAKYLGVTKPSVSNAMKKLRKDGLISFNSDGYISFSEEGRKAAENVLSKHVLITRILMKIGVSEKTALSDACKIEHAISDETYRCLMDYQTDHK
ncbi:MAG: helix-turn-helix domain-containing protein, partial [Lachnospiraceae bacterium]|nr:helix-turn-helix domain-containing protein [Lachnospiraceae bacterium]